MRNGFSPPKFVPQGPLWLLMLQPAPRLDANSVLTWKLAHFKTHFRKDVSHTPMNVIVHALLHHPLEEAFFHGHNLKVRPRNFTGEGGAIEYHHSRLRVSKRRHVTSDLVQQVSEVWPARCPEAARPSGWCAKVACHVEFRRPAVLQRSEESLLRNNDRFVLSQTRWWEQKADSRRKANQIVTERQSSEWNLQRTRLMLVTSSP